MPTAGHCDSLGRRSAAFTETGLSSITLLGRNRVVNDKSHLYSPLVWPRWKGFDSIAMGHLAETSLRPSCPAKFYRNPIAGANNRCHEQPMFFVQGAESARLPGRRHAVINAGAPDCSCERDFSTSIRGRSPLWFVFAGLSSARGHTPATLTDAAVRVRLVAVDLGLAASRDPITEAACHVRHQHSACTGGRRPDRLYHFLRLRKSTQGVKPRQT